MWFIHRVHERISEGLTLFISLLERGIRAPTPAVNKEEADISAPDWRRRGYPLQSVAAATLRMRATALIPPHCPSCHSPVMLTCPNLTEALIVCSDEAVRLPRIPTTLSNAD